MLTTRQAQAMIAAAEIQATLIAVPMNVTVLDAGANLKAFTRMDGALLGSIDVATTKARTAVLFDCSSEAIWEYCKPGGPAPGLELSNGGLAPFPGGIPVHGPDGQLLGAVGVSGGNSSQDLAVAKAAIAAFEN